MDYPYKDDVAPITLKDFGKNHHDLDTEAMRRAVAESGLCLETRELRLPPRPRVVQVYKSEI